MDLQFNKNEDANKLRLSEINKLYSQIKKGGGEKAMANQHIQNKTNSQTQNHLHH